ncbi:hypothetical protein [Cryobacterium sp. 10C3]|uniref:hypothetical protein n=1 Tax=Cryobacterium sp. 10C3 TaxID=3048577 RepID=UPI002AB5BD99|nr:hypothetical protein [Cryobacterium sp. 10C3]MDY7558296.1 hypothetical protein [Cryobacterium sp. 10C3]
MGNGFTPRRRWIAAGAAGLVLLVATVVLTVSVATGLAQPDQAVPALSLPDRPAPPAPGVDDSSPSPRPGGHRPTCPPRAPSAASGSRRPLRVSARATPRSTSRRPRSSRTPQPCRSC